MPTNRAVEADRSPDLMSSEHPTSCIFQSNEAASQIYELVLGKANLCSASASPTGTKEKRKGDRIHHT